MPLILALLLGVVSGSLAHANNAAVPVSSPAVKVAPSATPVPTPTPIPTITDAEAKSLEVQFKKALSQADAALDHQEKSALKEFYTAESQKVKEWRNREKRERRAFFDKHLSGPERRQYVQTYLSRKKEFDQSQKNDLNSFRLMWREKRDLFKKDKEIRMGHFKEALQKRLRPDPALWSF